MGREGKYCQYQRQNFADGDNYILGLLGCAENRRFQWETFWSRYKASQFLTILGGTGLLSVLRSNSTKPQQAALKLPTKPLRAALLNFLDVLQPSRADFGQGPRQRDMF
jgi:hypothetical protein